MSGQGTLSRPLVKVPRNRLKDTPHPTLCSVGRMGSAFIGGRCIGGARLVLSLILAFAAEGL